MSTLTRCILIKEALTEYRNCAITLENIKYEKSITPEGNREQDMGGYNDMVFLPNYSLKFYSNLIDKSINYSQDHIRS